MPSELQRVTLDTNCIIELEEERSEAQQVETLIGLQEQGAIHLRIVAISASERRPDGTYANNFQDFTSKLRNVGLQDAELLKPIGYWGVSYWNQAIYSTPQALQLEEQIHNILFPTIEYRYTDYCLAHGVDNPSKDLDIYPRWRNAKCDVLCMWAHIHYGGDVFATRDGNFHKATKKAALEALCAGRILTPSGSVDYLN